METEAKTSPHAKLLWREHWFRKRRLDVWVTQRDVATTSWAAAELHAAKDSEGMEVKRENKSSGQTALTLQHLQVKICFFPWHHICSGL